MIKTIVFGCIASISMSLKGQEYAFVQLPIGSMDTLLNVGVIHVASVNDNEKGITYTDTALVNYFFKQLSTFVNPDSVILVTEDPVYTETKDSIQTLTSIWITPQMESMGFRKWISADTRQSETGWYHKAELYLYEFLNEYTTTKRNVDSLNYFGIPSPVFTMKSDIPDDVADSVIVCLQVVAEDRAFVDNLQRVCDLARDMGYTPVVVAGYAHVLDLGKPCIIQVYDDPEMKGVLKMFSTYYSGCALEYVFEEFISRYDLEVILEK